MNFRLPLGLHGKGVPIYFVAFGSTLEVQQVSMASTSNVWASRIVESVFGIICARFRVFQRALIGSEDHCKRIVAAALKLRNLLVGRIPRQQLLQQFAPVPSEMVREHVSRAQAMTKAQT
ncbi:hypothetical protein Q1695_003045 [Nippostrongylus brasiliensis]|nr:hypothetical protein Q1695_003045 [Nippostrongylus brasiliensis]